MKPGQSGPPIPLMAHCVYSMYEGGIQCLLNAIMILTGYTDDKLKIDLILAHTIFLR